MSRISKGNAVTTAVLGVIACALGLGVAISSWNLMSKVSNFYVTTQDSNLSGLTFKSYWWGGLVYCVPGIIGIIVGCTRNVCAMVFYLIMNLLCMLSSVVVSIFCAIIMLAWSILDTLYVNGHCTDTSSLFYSKQCICTDYSGETYVINNVSCNQLEGIRPSLTAIVAMASLSSLVAFIASYVSCCALCNQEQDNGIIVVQQPMGFQQQQPQQNIIISNNSSTNQQQFTQQPGAGYYAQPPMYAPQGQQPGYYAQQPPPMYAQQPADVPTHDKANLVKSEVI